LEAYKFFSFVEIKQQILRMRQLTEQILFITLLFFCFIGVAISLAPNSLFSSPTKQISTTKDITSNTAGNTGTMGVNVGVAMANIPQGPQISKQPPQIAWQCVPGILAPISTDTEGNLQIMGNNQGTAPRFVKSMSECQELVKNMNGVDPWFFKQTAIACPTSGADLPEWCRLGHKLIAAQPSGPFGRAAGT
jgi:hypothetical protein